MLWLILEAFAAVLVLVFMVWWTMFSGRPSKERDPVRDHGSDRERDQP